MKNMNEKLIRLTESDLHRIVKESVNRVLNEIGDTERGQYMLGRLSKRKSLQGKPQDAKNVFDYGSNKRKEELNNPSWNNRFHYMDGAYGLGWEDQGKGGSTTDELDKKHLDSHSYDFRSGVKDEIGRGNLMSRRKNW